MDSTAFVTLSDAGYFPKAIRTILDIRSAGQWRGPIVLIAVDFTPSETFTRFYDVIVMSFPRIDVAPFLDRLREAPLSIPTHDNREWAKLGQWEKLHVFDPWFQRYARICYVDAGLRILAPVAESLLALDWRGRFLAPDDTGGDPSKTFSQQLEMTNWPAERSALESACPGLLTEPYFLNCIWVHDTSINVTKAELIDAMHKYPLWRTNEMGVMNVVIHFLKGLWTPFPERAANGKFLFDWCETNRGHTARWYDFCAIKYPITINFECN